MSSDVLDSHYLTEGALPKGDLTLVSALADKVMGWRETNLENGDPTALSLSQPWFGVRHNFGYEFGYNDANQLERTTIYQGSYLVYGEPFEDEDGVLASFSRRWDPLHDLADREQLIAKFLDDLQHSISIELAPTLHEVYVYDGRRHRVWQGSNFSRTLCIALALLQCEAKVVKAAQEDGAAFYMDDKHKFFLTEPPTFPLTADLQPAVLLDGYLLGG